MMFPPIYGLGPARTGTGSPYRDQAVPFLPTTGPDLIWDTDAVSIGLPAPRRQQTSSISGLHITRIG